MRRLALILAFFALFTLVPAPMAEAGEARLAPRHLKHHFIHAPRVAAPRRFHRPPAVRHGLARKKMMLAQQGYPSLRRPRLIPRRRLPPVFRPPSRVPRAESRRRDEQRKAARLSPSQALRIALRASPGSLGLGVDLLPPRAGRPPVYAVKLKTGSRIHRILVNAVDGRVIRR